MALELSIVSPFSKRTLEKGYARVDTFQFSRRQKTIQIRVDVFESKVAFDLGAEPLHTVTLEVSRLPTPVLKDGDPTGVFLPAFDDLTAKYSSAFSSVLRAVYETLKGHPLFKDALSA